jgi:hypothetical protein
VNASTRRTLIGALLLAAALLAVLWLLDAAGRSPSPARPAPLKPPPTAEPLVPTPLPAFRATAPPRATKTATPESRPTVTLTQRAGQHPVATRLPTSQAAARPIASAAPMVEEAPDAASATPAVKKPSTATVNAPTREPQTSTNRARVGAALAVGRLSDYDWGGAEPGWYLNWRVVPQPERIPGVRFAQMVRVNEGGFYPTPDVIRRAAQANPGSLWLIGNEPDVRWQDNVTPERYAAIYGELYAAIKEADRTAQVAIGGISQPTPLRLAYLDRVLAAYRAQFGAEMPVDVWNIHAFILREERGSWGVDIPPGMDANQGQLYEIADHNDMDIFRRQITDFRRWMAERGQRDKPLIVTEYGILMPASYGFPPDVVSAFLVDTFDFFLTARDPELGYPADEDRLVQAFNWFSIADRVYPTSNLFDPETRNVSPTGETFKAYVSGLR